MGGANMGYGWLLRGIGKFGMSPGLGPGDRWSESSYPDYTDEPQAAGISRPALARL